MYYNLSKSVYCERQEYELSQINNYILILVIASHVMLKLFSFSSWQFSRCSLEPARCAYEFMKKNDIYYLDLLDIEPSPKTGLLWSLIALLFMDIWCN